MGDSIAGFDVRKERIQKGKRRRDGAREGDRERDNFIQVLLLPGTRDRPESAVLGLTLVHWPVTGSGFQVTSPRKRIFDGQSACSFLIHRLWAERIGRGWGRRATSRGRRLRLEEVTVAVFYIGGCHWRGGTSLCTYLFRQMLIKLF